MSDENNATAFVFNPSVAVPLDLYTLIEYQAHDPPAAVPTTTATLLIVIVAPVLLYRYNHWKLFVSATCSPGIVTLNSLDVVPEPITTHPTLQPPLAFLRIFQSVCWYIEPGQAVTTHSGDTVPVDIRILFALVIVHKSADLIACRTLSGDRILLLVSVHASASACVTSGAVKVSCIVKFQADDLLLNNHHCCHISPSTGVVGVTHSGIFKPALAVVEVSSLNLAVSCCDNADLIACRTLCGVQVYVPVLLSVSACD